MADIGQPKHSYSSLYNLVVTQAPWLLGLPIKPSDFGKFLRIAADSIFGCCHLEETSKWAHQLVQTFLPRYTFLLDEVVKASGAIDAVTASVLGNIQATIKERTLFAFCQAQLSFRQYEIFVKCLSFENNIVQLKQLFLSKSLLKGLFQRTFAKYVGPDDTKTIYFPNSTIIMGHQWNLPALIDFIYKYLFEFLSESAQPVLIHRADAFPCGGKSCFLATLSLANLGSLANTILFNFVANMAYTNDRVFTDVVAAWDTNLMQIQQIQASRTITIGYLDLALPCSNKYSFDECFSRTFLGLNTSSSTYNCFKCYNIRNMNIWPDNILRVTSHLTQDTLRNQLGGHVRKPMVEGINTELDMGHCITHGLMAFGRIIVKWTYSTAINRKRIQPAQSFFDEILGVGKIDLQNPPPLGWSIKGCQSAQVLKNFSRLATILGVQESVTRRAEQLYRVIKILYTSDYSAEDEDWNWLESNIETVVNQFNETFVLGSECNYPHIFATHTKPFLTENKSLRLYSNTVLETLNASMKQHFTNRTSRHDFLWQAFQRHTMRLLSALESKEMLKFAMSLNSRDQTIVVFNKS